MASQSLTVKEQLGNIEPGLADQEAQRELELWSSHDKEIITIIIIDRVNMVDFIFLSNVGSN